MKKNLGFLWLILFGHYFLQAESTRLLVVGSLQFPDAITQPPLLKILYQGYKYPIEVSHEVQRTHQKGHFEFYIDSSCATLYIIVAENLQIPDQNNFDHLKTSADFSYRLFKLTRQEVSEEVKDAPRKLTWAVHEVNHTNEEIVLPDNTLIFFMPPSMIAKLEEESWPAEHHVSKLPRIVFHENITGKELQDVAARMTLALLDFEIFHAQLPKRFMVSDSRIVAIPYLQNTLHS